MVSQSEFDELMKSRSSSGLLRTPYPEKAETRSGESLQDLKTQIAEKPSVVDVVAITALSIEFEALERACSSAPHKFEGRELRDGVLYKKYKMFLSGSRRSSLTVALAQQDQMGMTSAAILATKSIRDFQPAYVAMTGICGGVSGECNLADVIIADTVFDYGSGKIRDGELRPNPRQFKLPVTLDTLLNEFQSNRTLLPKYRSDWPDQTHLPSNAESLRKGVMASGAAVVADAQVTDAVVGHQRKLLAIEMEAYGIAHAAHCSTTMPNWIVFKAVSDFADKKKNDSVHSYAAYLSARCLVDFLSQNADDLGIGE